MGYGSDNRSGGFRDRPRSGGFNRGGFGGRREGGFGGGRSSSGFGNRRPEMHDVVCDKCGNDCQVPFKPSGDKPVLCSDCFRKDGGASRDSSRSRDSSGSSSSSGMSQEQFKQINAKLDKIIAFLDQIEFEEEEDLDEDTEENEEGEVEEETKEDSEKEADETEISA